MPYRRLLLCPFVLLALSSCSDTREFFREKVTGERIGQPVGGPRRAPMLNPRIAAPVPPSPPPTTTAKITPTQPMAALGKKEEKDAANQGAKPEVPPYDQYDEKGNIKQEPQTNYLAEWFGGDAKKTPEKPVVTALNTGSGRKSFKGNMGASGAVAAPVILTPIVPNAPAEKLAEEVSAPLSPPAPAGIAEDVSPAVVPAPSVPMLESPADEGNGVIVPLLRDRPSAAAPSVSDAQPQQIAQLAPAAGNAAAPTLADVPEKPKAFEGIKKTKDAQQQQLLDDHTKAMEEQDQLNQEPTDLPTVEETIEEIRSALESPTPIVTASAGH